MGCVFFVITFFTTIISRCLVKCRCMAEEEEVEVDEKLGSYFECVPSKFRKRWLAEEVYMRKELGI